MSFRESKMLDGVQKAFEESIQQFNDAHPAAHGRNSFARVTARLCSPRSLTLASGKTLKSCPDTCPGVDAAWQTPSEARPIRVHFFRCRVSRSSRNCEGVTPKARLIFSIVHSVAFCGEFLRRASEPMEIPSLLAKARWV